MKLTNLLIASLIIAALSYSCSDQTELFNGENLDNWTIVLPDSISPESVFWVEENLLNISGIPNGYIRTNDEFENYKLHVEWRWVAEPKNSGVLLHVTGEEMVWPNCIEAQLMAGNAGDFVLIGKGAGITVGDTVSIIESEENRFKVIPKFLASSENSPGEWNSYDISVEGDVIELKINGVLQNHGVAATKTRGSIAIQSEGGPMQFRNIYLEHL